MKKLALTSALAVSAIAKGPYKNPTVHMGVVNFDASEVYHPPKWRPKSEIRMEEDNRIYKLYEKEREHDLNVLHDEFDQDWVNQRYNSSKEWERIYLISFETTVVISLLLLTSWKIYTKCQEMNDPTYKIPTRREEMIAENSLVLDGTDLEMRKMEYIQRKRGQKYPPTCSDNQETLP